MAAYSLICLLYTSTKDASGNTTYVKKSMCESEVKSILPKELSRYFFFDGERIEKMSKDISTGKKATDFAEAVKGLLGLNAMYSAIQMCIRDRSLIARNPSQD